MAFANFPGKTDPSLSCVLHLGIVKPVPIIVAAGYLGRFGDIEKIDVVDCHNSSLSQSSGIKIRYFDSRCTEKVIEKLTSASVESPVVVEVSIPGRELVAQLEFVSCRPVHTAITPDRTRFVSLADVRWTVGDTIACCQQFGELNTINNMNTVEALKHPQTRAASISFFDSRATAQFLKIFAAVAEASKQQNVRASVGSSWNQKPLVASSSPAIVGSIHPTGPATFKGVGQYQAPLSQNRRQQQKVFGKPSHGLGENMGFGIDEYMGTSAAAAATRGSGSSVGNNIWRVRDLLQNVADLTAADDLSGTLGFEHFDNTRNGLTYGKVAAEDSGEGLFGNNDTFNWGAEYNTSLGIADNSDYQQGPDYGEVFYKTLLEASGAPSTAHY